MISRNEIKNRIKSLDNGQIEFVAKQVVKK